MCRRDAETREEEIRGRYTIYHQEKEREEKEREARLRTEAHRTKLPLPHTAVCSYL